MSSHVCVFCVFQQYNPATTTEVETLLKTQKAENPGRIPYLMCRRGVPGYLNLLYIPGNRCDDDEYIHEGPRRSHSRHTFVGKKGS